MAQGPNALAAVTLDDKYALEKGRIYLTGTQALVRLPLLQRQRDVAAGLNTGCFISGYRGSPLGGFDQALWSARRFVERNHLKFQPAINEELAATAVWGSQQIGLFPGAKYDGVFAVWYGKGPGVDRSGDALKHGNSAGTAPYGGVLALAGDDHTCKSSTLAHQSEFAFIDALIPVLNPAGVEDILDLGLYGWAMSRYSGCWVALKTVAETMDSSASIVGRSGAGRDRAARGFRDAAGRAEHPLARPAARPGSPAAPLQDTGGDRLRPRQPARPHRHRRAAAALRHRHDRKILSRRAAGAGRTRHRRGRSRERWACGSTRWRCPGRSNPRACGASPRVSTRCWSSRKSAPSSRRSSRSSSTTGRPTGARASSASSTRAARGYCRRTASCRRRRSPASSPARLAALGDPAVARRAGRPPRRARAADRRPRRNVVPFARTPYFCSGCPHNTSTRVPEGSRALAGIGCHYLSQFMDRNTATFTQMGGEGAAWIGQAPFVETAHVFANIGDGTYTHSGILAIRAAVAAGVNDDLQGPVQRRGRDDRRPAARRRPDGAAGRGAARRRGRAPDRHRHRRAATNTRPAPNSRTARRCGTATSSTRVQRELREMGGVTAIVYDQTCAAEKRRRRKRGRFPGPAAARLYQRTGLRGLRRLLGGLELPVGRAGRDRIRPQARDRPVELQQGFFLPQGLLPEFCDGAGRQPAQARAAADLAETTICRRCPSRRCPALAEPYGILVTGVGGTGVVTIGALLGMAAHLEGKGVAVLDQLGMAQKGGAVMSHVRIAERPDADPRRPHRRRQRAPAARLRPRRVRQRRGAVEGGAGDDAGSRQQPRDHHRRLHAQPGPAVSEPRPARAASPARSGRAGPNSSTRPGSRPGCSAIRSRAICSCSAMPIRRASCRCRRRRSSARSN